MDVKALPSRSNWTHGVIDHFLGLNLLTTGPSQCVPLSQYLCQSTAAFSHPMSSDSKGPKTLGDTSSAMFGNMKITQFSLLAAPQPILLIPPVNISKLYHIKQVGGINFQGFSKILEYLSACQIQIARGSKLSVWEASWTSPESRPGHPEFRVKVWKQENNSLALLQSFWYFLIFLAYLSCYLELPWKLIAGKRAKACKHVGHADEKTLELMKRCKTRNRLILNIEAGSCNKFVHLSIYIWKYNESKNCSILCMKR